MAQERPLDNREKAAVGFNAPVEGLSVSGPGRYYPAEYSPQIAALGKKTEAISRIPESLARIIEYADEYKINAYGNREQAELYKAELKSEVYRDTLALDSANRVKDKSLQLQEALIKAKVASEESNGDIPLTEAYQEVFNSDEFRNPTEFTSLNSQKNWQSIYNRMQEEYSVKALETDIFNTRAEMEMHVNQATDVLYREASSIGTYPTDIMDRFMRTTYLYRNHMTAKQLADSQNKMWELAVTGYANYILNKAERYAADPSDPLGLNFKDAEDSLRELVDNCVYKRLGYEDDKGDIIKDPDGQDKMFAVSLSPQVQDEILKNIKSLHNKQQGTGAGDTEVAGIYKGLLKELNLPENFEIDKPEELQNVFKGMLGKSTGDLRSALDNFMGGVVGSPASPATKNKYLEKGVQLLGFVDTLAAARDGMTAKDGDPDAVKRELALIGQKIDNGLRSGQPITKWLPSIAVGDKKFIPYLDGYRKQYGIPEQVDGAFVERQYLENVSSAFKNLSSMDTDDLLSYLSPDLYAAINTAGVVNEATGQPIATVDSQNIIEGIGTAAPRINPKEVEKAAADMAQMQALTEKHGGRYLPDDFIMKRAKEYGADNPLGAMFLAKTAVQDKVSASDSLEKFAAKNINSGKNDDKAAMSRNILKGMLVVNDADLEKGMSDYYAQFPSDELRKAEYDKVAKGKAKAALDSIEVSLSRYKVPGVYRPALESLSQDIAVYYTLKGENNSQIIGRVNKVIKDNFVELNHAYNGQMIYKNSSVLKSWGDVESMNSCLDSVYKDTRSAVGVKLDFLPDLETGRVAVLVGGEPFTAPVYLHTPKELGLPVGNPYNNEAISLITNLDVASSYLLGDARAMDSNFFARRSDLSTSNVNRGKTSAQLRAEYEGRWRVLKSALSNTEKVRKMANNYVKSKTSTPDNAVTFNYDLAWKGGRFDPIGLRMGQRGLFGENAFLRIGHPGFVPAKKPHVLMTTPSNGGIMTVRTYDPYLMSIMRMFNNSNYSNIGDALESSGE